MNDRIADPVRGAQALFWFHLALLSWWAFVQFYYRVVMRFLKGDPEFAMGVVSLALVFTALIVTAQFAQGRRGTASQTAARVAMVFAAADLIGETLQFVPRLGFPALIPHDGSGTELLLRGIWVSCEFAMRCAMFVALWRAQADVDARVGRTFFVLIATSYLVVSISFLRSLGPFQASVGALPFGAFAAKLATPLCLSWLAILVYLSRRAASGEHPARLLTTRYQT